MASNVFKNFLLLLLNEAPLAHLLILERLAQRVRFEPQVAKIDFRPEITAHKPGCMKHAIVADEPGRDRQPKYNNEQSRLSLQVKATPVCTEPRHNSKEGNWRNQGRIYQAVCRRNRERHPPSEGNSSNLPVTGKEKILLTTVVLKDTRPRSAAAWRSLAGTGPKATPPSRHGNPEHSVSDQVNKNRCQAREENVQPD